MSRSWKNMCTCAAMVAIIGIAAASGSSSVATATPSAASAHKVLGGTIYCAPGEPIISIWFLGSKSGWHGYNFPSTQLVYGAHYKISVQTGETIKYWLNCSVWGKSYNSFKVGRGSTRNICSPGYGVLSFCNPNLANCALDAIFGEDINLYCLTGVLSSSPAPTSPTNPISPLPNGPPPATPLPPALSGPPSVSVSASGGALLVQLSNFPLGQTYFFCHYNGDYPYGGTVNSNAPINITSPNQSFTACPGSGAAWIGLQATDHNDYYSNTVTL